MSPEERRRREPGFRHALALAERLRTPRDAERLLVLALASHDLDLARAVLFQAQSRGWELVAGRHLEAATAGEQPPGREATAGTPAG